MSTLPVSPLQASDLDPDTYRHPRVAALHFGRRLNQLFHWAQVAWITGDVDHNRRVEMKFRDLQRLSRHLSADEMIRDQLFKYLEGEANSLNDLANNEAACEEHAMMLNDLRTVRSRGRVSTGYETQSSVLEDFVIPQAHWLERFRTSLLGQISSEVRTEVTFGEYLDRVLHPSHVVPFVRVAWNDAQEPAMGWDQATRSAPPYFTKPTFEIMPGTDLTRDTWTRELYSRWSQLAFAAGSFPEWSEETSPQEAVRAIEAAYREQVQDTEPVSVERRTYLGVTLVNGVLRRKGFDANTPITKNQHAKFLEYLLEAKHRIVPKNEFLADWQSFGGRSDFPRSDVITPLVSHLNRLIRPLGLKINCLKEIGLRLEELTQEFSEN